MKQLNKMKRAQSRMHDFTETINTRSKESQVQLRKETGGFHKPGSNNK